MKRFQLTLIPLVLALVVPAAALGQDDWDSSEWLDCDQVNHRYVKHCEEQKSSWKSTGKPLQVDSGRNGGAAVRGWNRDEVSVRATIHVYGKSEREAKELAKDVRVHMTDGRIWAEGPGTGKGDENDHPRWSVTFRIYVPHRTDLDLRAYNGPVSARDVEGELRLETHNGPLALSRVAGDVYGRTRNGPLTVRLDGVRWKGTGLDVETRNGPVNLKIPENYSATLESGTRNGPWDVDLALPPGLRLRRGRHFTTELGRGGTKVRVVTHNGPLAIATI